MDRHVSASVVVFKLSSNCINTMKLAVKNDGKSKAVFKHIL
jgi:hypothetical protein